MPAEVLNILVPMAGRGSRFADAGHTCPKPLLPAQGRPMIERVIHNLQPRRPHRFIFICQQAHLDAHALAPLLRRAGPATQIVGIHGVTEGAACTTLLAAALIDSPAPLMIANCDQYVAVDIDEHLDAVDASGHDGVLMTMTAHDPKWSYARCDGHGRVLEVAEKRVISDEATTGIYHFRRGCDYVAAARRMIAAGERTNGEFYVAPAYNHLVRAGLSVGTLNIGPDSAAMFGLGVPEDLDTFNRLPGLPRPWRAAAPGVPVAA
jgi:NDP-sugar pyrophosphorylase family protein